MARCRHCGTWVVFGGTRDGEYRYCNSVCQSRDLYREIAPKIPQDIVDEQVRLIYEGPCPRCSGPGPVDVHVAHSVWSAVALTSWKSQPGVSCRSCGRKRQLGAAALSAVIGWWGFPWGLIFTPIQIGRNMFGMLRSAPWEPSAQLENVVRNMLVAQISQRAASASDTDPNPDEHTAQT